MSHRDIIAFQCLNFFLYVVSILFRFKIFGILCFGNVNFERKSIILSLTVHNSN